ncbi:MAG TPA: transglutaminase-like domain-containing protein, partial [Methanobacterium sp.]|nr:transglutaminase-like domain-containing protein [Methanobacterium sp.]
ADTGTAQIQSGNHHAVAKNIKLHKNDKFLNKSIKTHKKAVKPSKAVKKIKKSQNITSQKRNKVGHAKFYAAAGSYKKIKLHYSANTGSINSLASSITSGSGSQYNKGTKVFNWVRDNVRYRFYYNTRYGADGTLKNRAGNCADQAHLVVALARSSGLNARYVHAKAHFTSGHVYGHVWAQIEANGQWYTADTTSKRNSFGVARNWNSAKIEGVYNNLPI